MPQAVSNVVNLSDYHTGGRSTGSTSSVIKPRIDAEPEISGRTVSIDELLEPGGEHGSALETARSNLVAVLRALENASPDDPIERDTAVMLLQAELPHSFSLKGWSDGAYALIVALHHALRNNRGDILSDGQYLRVVTTTRMLKENPALRFDRALDFVEALSHEGFVVEPEEVLLLQDDFDD